MPSKTQQSARASQEILLIDEIRDGVIILKNKGMRVALMASSINFGLKSNDEQDAIILQYQNFLNSLDFSVQFFISSRALNITPYLDSLRARLEKEPAELLKIQTTEYIEFIRNFVNIERIVSKSFYIVVPYDPPLIEIGSGFTNKLAGLFKAAKKKPVTQEAFEERRAQLFQRVETVMQGLLRTGVRSAPLNTEELIELFYSLYNPGESQKGKAPAVKA